ncbi:carboxypeptidase-like regulatory domain-containing protein [Sphingobacterium sp. E70]|uniref:carboxypeptidase-like regulatory domain-containing protein n=1 Tax=Sphingobacterium sp. E70 TaxID=2853439 RepID=UPI00211CB7EB|nr:carboxypeptidase-like regulatory domain-containing protein [Sphingobacterium sp. E70]ULT22859.1 carboxypeptidase-like regulatory domain-containing protein [Sphingobacterium sp. E70]
MSITLLSSFALQAQNIQGIVHDKSTGVIVPGASIIIKERPQGGTVADGNGKFSLVLHNGETLLVKMVGYKSYERYFAKVQEGQQVEISLESGVALDEVLVTASLANSRSKRAIGTNVDHIDAADIVAKSNPSSLAELVNGRISGAQVYNTNGKVGMPIRFDIRSAATFSMERIP